jgi:hypothetical protein
MGASNDYDTAPEAGSDEEEGLSDEQYQWLQECVPDSRDERRRRRDCCSGHVCPAHHLSCCCRLTNTHILTFLPLTHRQLAHIGHLRIEEEGEGEEEEEWVDPSGGVLLNIYAACESGDADRLAASLADLATAQHSIDTPGAWVVARQGWHWQQEQAAGVCLGMLHPAGRVGCL